MEIYSPNVQNCVDYINMICIKLKINYVLPLYKCFTALKASFQQGHELDCTTCVPSNRGSKRSCSAFSTLSAYWVGEALCDLHKKEQMTMPFRSLV